LPAASLQPASVAAARPAAAKATIKGRTLVTRGYRFFMCYSFDVKLHCKAGAARFDEKRGQKGARRTARARCQESGRWARSVTGPGFAVV
jgi:hypothetical protein